MPRPPPLQKPTPKKSGNLRREPCPVTTAPQRRSVPPPVPPQNAAGVKSPRIRREPTPRHHPPQKNPAICTGSLVPLQQRRKKKKPSHPPGTHPQRQPRKKSRQFAPGALSRYNSAAKRKNLRIRREPTPPPANLRKKSGRLPRSATFPLFKRRKMRYTGKEIHPDTEDET